MKLARMQTSTSLGYGLICMLCLTCNSVGVIAQTKPDKTSQLTDGLLDLLNEPEAARKKADPQESVELNPEDVGLVGEDLGEQSGNPLASVRQSMLIAAEFLNRGVTGNTTQTLQGDIVERLDDIIRELENAKAGQNKKNSSESQQGASESEPTPSSSSENEAERQQQEVARQQREPGESSDAKQDAPGNSGEANALKSLQRDAGSMQLEVWGQLPERVRKQMQSTMVEQFLPSYREQIEAYFEALLKDPS